MASDFSEQSDILHPVAEPFAIMRSGSWLCVGVGRYGLILKHVSGEDPTLRWIGQVAKFMTMEEYLPPDTITRLLSEQGVFGVKWQG